MRWRAGNVRDATSRKPAEMRIERLIRIREDHRGAADNGTKKNLQTAIATNVVKCCPNRGLRARRWRCDGADKSAQGVGDELRRASRTRRCQHPLGFACGCR